MGLLYVKWVKSKLFGYTDSSCLSDPHKVRSRTVYMFTCGNTTILWWLIEQTMVATSSDHPQILTIHETNRKNMWLRFEIQYIWESCGLSYIKDNSTILYEDNVVYIT